ncbi:MAG TPA: hypothetical protein VN025_06900 [Candidatus Dormibacteraeota bacterium]|jgi:hypothetical protein|nr:hypothetical protein [Candidatus Dormibacteraeota bacterium]
MTPRLSVLITIVLLFPLSAHSQSPQSQDEPRIITYCELAADPSIYNHALVRITGFVSHGFEDFQLSDPYCPTLAPGFSVWLTYGDTAESNTTYCCPGEPANGGRPTPLIVDGIKIPLVTDSVLARFKSLLMKEPDTTVHATFVGRFFSGEGKTVEGKTLWRGYGHLGCCSLLAVQRVESFDPHQDVQLDYSAEAGSYENEGCKINSVHWLRHISVSGHDEDVLQAITEQEMADNGPRNWAFTDPKRVADDAIASLYKNQAPPLKRVKETPTRQIFLWKREKKSTVVVVTKPYWLSFHAKSNSIIWVATVIKEADCR